MLKKSKYPVILLSLVFILSFSLSGSAVNYDLAGGSFYTTLTLTNLNNAIENYNESIEQAQQEGDLSVTKMDKMNSAIGFFGGLGLSLRRNFGLGATFESFSTGTGTEITVDDQYGEIDLDIGIDLAVNGLVTMLNTDLNDYIGLSGGGGYYYGTLDMTANISASGDYADYIQNESFSETANVSGFGFKAGGSLHYPLTRQSILFSEVHYRMLSLETGEENNLTNDTTLNANGIEMRLGVAFRF